MAGMEQKAMCAEQGGAEHRCCVPLLCLALLAGAHPATGASPPERSCAAYGPRGDWAAAVAGSGSLAFEMHASNAPAKALSMHYPGDLGWCQVFLSADGRYAALGMHAAVGNDDVLQIGVFDRSASTWSSNFIVKHRRLDGFLGDTSRLVVTRRSEPKPGEGVNVEISLFGPDGQTAADGSLVRTVPGVNRFWSADPVDARHNRLWFMNGRQFCPLSSMTLVGGADSGPSIGGAAVGGACLLQAIGFPSADAVVGGTTGNQDLMWRADLGSGSSEKIELPKAKRGPLTRWVAGAMSPTVEVSPDGEALVISRSFTPWDILDRAHDGGGELDVIQSKPLKVLAVIPNSKACVSGGFAVDHRDGSAIVLQRLCGKWERKEFPMPAR